MKVLYILNESSFYMKLAWFSMASLRHYNPDIPVDMLLVRDGGRDSRDVAGRERLWLGIPDMDLEQFAHEASTRFGAFPTLVADYEPGVEAGFPPAQRKEFSRVEGEEVLFLDADTFVLGELGPLFSSPHDVMADRNTWTSFSGTDLDGTKSFNSGVVLFKKGLHREYGDSLHRLLARTRDDGTRDGRWMREAERYWSERGYSGVRTGREELAFCLWATERDSGQFGDREVQTINYRHPTRVFHTMTPYWLQNWPRFFDGRRFKPPRRMGRILLPPGRSKTEKAF
jgi:hypothetical protein